MGFLGREATTTQTSLTMLQIRPLQHSQHQLQALLSTVVEDSSLPTITLSQTFCFQTLEIKTALSSSLSVAHNWSQCVCLHRVPRIWFGNK